MKKNIFVIVACIVCIAIVVVILLVSKKSFINNTQNENKDLVVYTDGSKQISFSYPRAWGEVSVMSANTECPEEDTYRTAESLTIRDEGYAFKDIDLDNTDSLVRSGIMTYRLDPNNLPDCNCEALKLFATGVVAPETFSSVQLTSVTINGMKGIYNETASRLDTEARVQYTIFRPNDDGTFTVVQPYFSVIPFANSPEWKEIDAKYDNNSSGWLKEGETSAQVRKYLGEFKAIAESVTSDLQ